MPAVLVLVVANGFFVATEFLLVAVRRSRVIELAASGRMNAQALVRWAFKIVDMDGRRIDKLLARRTPTPEA